MTKAWHGGGKYPQMAWYAETEPHGVPFLSSFNLHDYSTTGTRIPHPLLYG